MKHRFIKAAALILFVSATKGQSNKPFALKSVSDISSFSTMAENDSTLAMVELKTLIPDIKYDLRYATRQNFTKVRLYPKNTKMTFMRLMPARALAKVADELRAMGLGIKVWDAYRPYSITVKFWKLIQDERYVANPSKGSGHNRGTSIDLILIDLETGKEIAMPTDFDNFSDTAHHGAKSVDQLKIKNRELLSITMEKFGFNKLATEWWHYSWPNPGRYDVLDLSFKQLGAVKNQVL